MTMMIWLSKIQQYVETDEINDSYTMENPDSDDLEIQDPEAYQDAQTEALFEKLMESGDIDLDIGLDDDELF